MDSPASLQEISSADAALAARLRKIHSIAIGVAVIWFVASVVGTLWLSNRIFAHDLMQVADDATRDTHATARVVDRIFHEFATIPRVLSNNRGVIGIVDRYNAQEPGLAGLTEEQRGTRLKNDPEVRIQGDRLTRIRKQLNYGLVYVIDSHGIVVVSSDWDRDPSFVGLKVDDRQYFNDAMAGREGQMFAVARISSDPVLIFSTPIQGKAGPIGAVALSQRISVVGTMLSVGHQVTLVVDHNGMVVATSHPEFYLHYISEADRAPLSNFTHVMPAPDADTLRKIYNQENLRTTARGTISNG
jgi:C4-dicarboxylate-specific signal transduction histidine kinase